MIFTYVSVPDMEAFLESSDTGYNILITMVLDLSKNGVDTTLRFIVIENTLMNSNETMTKRIETAFIVYVERGINKNSKTTRCVSHGYELMMMTLETLSLEPRTHLS